MFKKLEIETVWKLIGLSLLFKQTLEKLNEIEESFVSLLSENGENNYDKGGWYLWDTEGDWNAIKSKLRKQGYSFKKGEK